MLWLGGRKARREVVMLVALGTMVAILFVAWVWGPSINDLFER